MSQYVFVSDMFIQDYRGGAELTTEALIRSMPFGSKFARTHSHTLTTDMLRDNAEFHYIVCNFASLHDDVKLFMCRNEIQYSIVEYDYKFCKYRSMEKHLALENKKCDCVEKHAGKINSAFYGYASKVWFMSEAQMNIFLTRIKVLKSENCEVLSSVFMPGDLAFMGAIKENEKDGKYLILGSNSWIKGTQDCIQYANDNELEFEIVSGLPYHELLIKMSTSKGLIFLPLGADTCPRFVIEAKLLGCDLRINENVQHKDEPWFETQESTAAYLADRTSVFWSHYEG